MTEEEKGRRKKWEDSEGPGGIIDLDYVHSISPSERESFGPDGAIQPPPGLREDGAEEQPGHRRFPPAPHSATRKITRRPTGSLQGDKHGIPTQMGGMDVVMAKGEVLAIAHSDGLEYHEDSSVLSCLSRDGSNDWGCHNIKIMSEASPWYMV